MSTIPIGEPVIPCGRPGPTGPRGPTGPQGVLPEPVANVNGRYPGSWVPSLPLTGGAMSGGLSFGSAYASSPTDLSRHIALWGTGYGFSVTSSNLNCLSGQDHDFYCGGAWSLRFRGHAIHFSTDGWRLDYNPGNHDVIYYNWASQPLFGCVSSMVRFVVWGNFETAGYIQLRQPVGSGLPAICFNNINGGHWFQYLWANGMIGGYVNGGFAYYFASACDERLKQDVSPSKFDCLETIRKIRLWQFRWRDHQTPNHPQPAAADAPIIPIGFVAQRLDEDFPQAVVKDHGGGKAWWNADPNTVLATLCGALQDLDREITAIEEKQHAARRSDA